MEAVFKIRRIFYLSMHSALFVRHSTSWDYIRRYGPLSSCEREEGLRWNERAGNGSYLLGAPVAVSDILAIFQPSEDLLYCGQLISHILLLQTVAAWTSLLLLRLKRLFHELDVLEPQLLGDDVQIASGVHVTLDMNNLCIVKATDHLEDGINGTNVGQEGVAQASAS